MLAGITLLIAILSHSTYAQPVLPDINIPILTVGADVDITLPLAEGGSNVGYQIIPTTGQTGNQLITGLPGLMWNNDPLVRRIFGTPTQATTAPVMIIYRATADDGNNSKTAAVTIVCQPGRTANMMGMCIMADAENGGGMMGGDEMIPPVAERRDSNDDFEKVAYSAGVAIIGSVIWNYYRNRNPSFSDRFNFTAIPTSNKSLQYNLSTNINKNWSANFTVDKQVKINSDTTNSQKYKLEFKYQF